MFSKYKYFFDMYLRICKGMYNLEKPYDNLEKCIEACNNRKHELFGMLYLLKEAGEITDADYEAEDQRVTDTFSSIKLFNAFTESGEVMIFAERR